MAFSRTGFLIAGSGVFCGRLACFAILGVVAVCESAAAQPPRFVKWNLEATVIEVIDPGGLFPDFRLGDPVRGSLKYNVDDEPIPMEDYAAGYYQPQYGVATMMIENPRTSNEISFVRDLSGFLPWADVHVVNDHPDENSDAVFFLQSVLPFPGYSGEQPVLEVDLLGPPEVLFDLSLPLELDLNDWPFATIAFYDFAEQDPFGTTIVAEIFSLTPMPIPPGDFDTDGNVDVDDYNYWRATFGPNKDLSADANGDWTVDAADYVVWRKSFNQTAGSSSDTSLNVTVPEPATSVMLILAAAGWCLRRVRPA